MIRFLDLRLNKMAVFMAAFGEPDFLDTIIAQIVLFIGQDNPLISGFYGSNN